MDGCRTSHSAISPIVFDVDESGYDDAEANYQLNWISSNGEEHCRRRRRPPEVRYDAVRMDANDDVKNGAYNPVDLEDNHCCAAKLTSIHCDDLHWSVDGHDDDDHCQPRLDQWHEAPYEVDYLAQHYGQDLDTAESLVR